jgi:hypothetical protein
MPIRQAENEGMAIMITATGSEIRLIDWVAPDTWSSGDPLDEQRFFKFVSALWLEHGVPIDGDELFAQIADEVTQRHPDIDPELLERKIDQYVGQAQVILRYNRTMIEAA